MNLLNFYIPEWIFVAVNLLILILALKKILWGPVSKVLDERQALVEQGFADVEAAREIKLNMEADRQAMEAELEREAAEQMKQARIQAGRDYDRIVAEAEDKARKLVTAAQLQAEQESATMMTAAKASIIALSLEAAGLLMETNMDSDQNRRLVEHYLAQKDVAV